MKSFIDRGLPPGSRQLLSVSVEALSQHKLRTLLASLSITIGVTAFTAMLSVGEGARRELVRQVQLLGLENIVIRPRHPATETATDSRPARLTLRDVEGLRALVPVATAWSPVSETFARLVGPATSTTGSVIAVALDYQSIMSLRVGRGRLLSILDYDRDARVCLLGSSISQSLFGQSSALRRTLSVDRDLCVIVGILEPRISVGTSGGTLSPRDLNNAVIRPVQRKAAAAREPWVSEIWVQVASGENVASVAPIVAHALTQLHEGRDDFEVLVPRELLRQRLKTQRTFNMVLGSVAVLTLLVGGIGIMNVLLASVLERTSEIGLRRAVGATRRSISAQFLSESLLIALAGGMVGLVVGALVASGLTRYAGWPTYVSPWAGMLSLCVACAVGLGSATYPARRAARLDPIDAVRYE